MLGDRVFLAELSPNTVVESKIECLTLKLLVVSTLECMQESSGNALGNLHPRTLSAVDMSTLVKQQPSRISFRNTLSPSDLSPI